MSLLNGFIVKAKQLADKHRNTIWKKYQKKSSPFIFMLSLSSFLPCDLLSLFPFAFFSFFSSSDKVASVTWEIKKRKINVFFFKRLQTLEDFGCLTIKWTWLSHKALQYSYVPSSLAVNWQSVLYCPPLNTLLATTDLSPPFPPWKLYDLPKILTPQYRSHKNLDFVSVHKNCWPHS